MKFFLSHKYWPGVLPNDTILGNQVVIIKYISLSDSYKPLRIRYFTIPPASEASRELANLTERKNPHAPVYVVKKFVRLLQTLTPVISGLADFTTLFGRFRLDYQGLAKAQL